MLNVLIADDHAIVREGLKKIFALVDDVKVSAEAADGDEVIQHLRSTEHFHLLLLDLTMPGVSGIDLIGRIKAYRADIPILVFSMHNEPQVVFRAIKAGASGYLTKDSDPEVLIYAIHKVAAGGKYIDPLLSERMAFDVALPGQRELHTKLSDREFEIFGLLVAGNRVFEIAERLAISNKTVSTHKLHLMDKLKVASTAELVYYAIKHDLFYS